MQNIVLIFYALYAKFFKLNIFF